MKANARGAPSAPEGRKVDGSDTEREGQLLEDNQIAMAAQTLAPMTLAETELVWPMGAPEDLVSGLARVTNHQGPNAAAPASRQTIAPRQHFHVVPGQRSPVAGHISGMASWQPSQTPFARSALNMKSSLGAEGWGHSPYAPPMTNVPSVTRFQYSRPRTHLGPPPLSAECQNILLTAFLGSTEIMRVGTFHVGSFLSDCIAGTQQPALFSSVLWFASLFVEHPDLTRSTRADLQNRTLALIADLDCRFWTTEFPEDPAELTEHFSHVGLPLIQCLVNGVFGILRSSGSPLAAKRFLDELGKVMLRLGVHNRRRKMPGSDMRGSSGDETGKISPQSDRARSAAISTASSGSMYSPTHSYGLPPLPILTARDWIAWQGCLRMYWFIVVPTDATLAILTRQAPSLPEFDPGLEFPVDMEIFNAMQNDYVGQLPTSGLTAADVIGWIDIEPPNLRRLMISTLQTDRWPDILYASLLVLWVRVVSLECWRTSVGLETHHYNAALLNRNDRNLSAVQREGIVRRDRLLELIADAMIIAPAAVRVMDENGDGASLFILCKQMGWNPPHLVWGPINLCHTLNMVLSAPPPLTNPPPQWYLSQAFLNACSHAISISTLLRSALPFLSPLALSIEPYAILYAAWIHIMAVRRMLDGVGGSYNAERLKEESKPFLDMLSDANTCLEYLRATGTAGWKHMMDAMNVVARLVDDNSGWTEEEEDLVAMGNRRAAASAPSPEWVGSS